MNKKYILPLLILFATTSLFAQEKQEKFHTGVLSESSKTDSKAVGTNASFPYGITEFTPPELTKIDPNDKVSRYRPRVRITQGVPGFTVTPGGRLWSAWMTSSSQTERGPRYRDNYILFSTSGDDGKTWKEVFAFDPSLLLDGGAGDAVLWVDKNGKLRCTITRSMKVDNDDVKNRKRTTAWEFIAQNGDNEDPNWGEPRYLSGHNIAMEPTELSNGTLIRPMDDFYDLKNPRKTKFLVEDQKTGKKLFISEAEILDTDCAPSEQMILEKKDGTLFSFVRTSKGKGQKYITSKDMGKTWEDHGYFPVEFSVGTKCVVKRAPTGEVILVANESPNYKDPETGEMVKKKFRHARSDLTAFLSLDDGKTFPYKFLIDGSFLPSYPNICFSKDGFIYIAYDNHRYKFGRQEIRFAKITIEDIKAGKLVNPKSRLKQIVSNLKEHGGGVRIGDSL